MRSRCDAALTRARAAPADRSHEVRRQPACDLDRTARAARRSGRIARGADKGYDTADFIATCRDRGVTRHVAQHTTNRRNRIDERVTRHPGYAGSQRVRKRVEEIFGWAKTLGVGRKPRYIGVAKNQLWAHITGTAFNLVRMAARTHRSPGIRNCEHPTLGAERAAAETSRRSGRVSVA